MISGRLGFRLSVLLAGHRVAGSGAVSAWTLELRAWKSGL